MLYSPLCYYGCDQEARFQFRNGKWCCCENYRICPKLRINNSKANKGKISPLRGRKLTEDHKRKIRESGSGKEPWNKGKIGVFSEEALKKLSIASTGRKHTEEEKFKIGRGNRGKKINREYVEKTRLGLKKYYETHPGTMLGKKHTIEAREKMRQGMLNGRAVMLLKRNKFISKPQKYLYEIVKFIFPEAEINFIIENSIVDIAIVSLKIVIEYDGYYWHLGKEKEDLERQTKIEKLGWKFIRYRGEKTRDPVPTLEQVKLDIDNLLKGE